MLPVLYPIRSSSASVPACVGRTERYVYIISGSLEAMYRQRCQQLHLPSSDQAEPCGSSCKYPMQPAIIRSSTGDSADSGFRASHPSTICWTAGFPFSWKSRWQSLSWAASFAFSCSTDVALCSGWLAWLSGADEEVAWSVCIQTAELWLLCAGVIWLVVSGMAPPPVV